MTQPLEFTGEFAATRAPDLVRALVTVGPLDTEYLRGGRGAPLLVLGADAGDPRHAALLGALAAHFRVLAPASASGALAGATGDDAFARWMLGFLDCLGVECATVVAAGASAAAAQRFAAAEPARVRRVVPVDLDAAIAAPATAATAVVSMLANPNSTIS